MVYGGDRKDREEIQMKRRFSDRVSVEREVLALVNNHISGPSLPGLSKKALAKWQSDGAIVSNEVFHLIECISVRASLDMNASRDVFSEDELQLNSSVDSYIQKLKDRLSQRHL